MSNMIIKKLYKCILLMILSLPCMASDSDYDMVRYRIETEGRDFLVELGAISALAEAAIPAEKPHEEILNFSEKSLRKSVSESGSNIKLSDSAEIAVVEVSSVDSTATTPDLSYACVLKNLYNGDCEVNEKKQKRLSAAEKTKDINIVSTLETKHMTSIDSTSSTQASCK